MGRLNQGLHADLLGEHVVLEAQRAIERLRRSAGVATRLIVASMREWQTFVRVAECDACTAPAAVLARAPGAVRGGACGAHQWSRDVVRGRDARRRPRAPALGAARLARLWRV